MGKRRVASHLVKVEGDLSASDLMPKLQTRGLPCALREVIQPTCAFTAMTICTEVKKLQGHAEEYMSVHVLGAM